MFFRNIISFKDFVGNKELQEIFTFFDLKTREL